MHVYVWCVYVCMHGMYACVCMVCMHVFAWCVCMCMYIHDVNLLTYLEVCDDDMPDVIYKSEVNPPPGLVFFQRVTAAVVPPDGACVTINPERGVSLRSYGALGDGHVVGHIH